MSCSHLETANAGKGFLWTTLIFLNTNSPKGIQLPLILSGEFLNQGRLTFVTREDPEVTWLYTRKTLSQTIIPIICSSKGPFIFPKNSLLSPKRTVPTSLSQLRWEIHFYFPSFPSLPPSLPLSILLLPAGILIEYSDYADQSEGELISDNTESSNPSACSISPFS